VAGLERIREQAAGAHLDAVHLVSVGRNTARRDKHRRRVAQGRPDCALCGELIDYSLRHPDPGCFTIDHIVPIARGGEDVYENVQPSHFRCNRAKSDGPVERKLKRAVAFVTERTWN
jgi:5-methylcytosine-specific restriction endonuclease McrA